MRRLLLTGVATRAVLGFASAAVVIDKWEDALPLGNGQAGALVWGGGNTLCLSLDRADYWHLSTNTMFRNPGFTWKNLVAHATCPLEDRKRIFEGRVGDSTKLPGVRLELTFDNAEIDGFMLDLAKAEAVVALCCMEDRARELRAWFVDGDPLLHVALPEGVEIKSAEFVKNPAIDRLGGYPNPVVTRTSDKIVYRRGHREKGEWAKEFVAGIRLVAPDAPSDTAWWNRFRAESSVSVPDGAVQRLYDFAMYLYGSGSREGFAPIALQGLWTADNGDLPPWHGDYHHDLNSQMTYWASAVAGHFNSHDAFTSHLTKLMPTFRAYTRRFFEIDRGFVVPGAMGYDGSFIAGWSQYAIPPSSGLWMFSILYDGWLYCPTRDRLESIYPFGVGLAEAADLLLLPPDEDGVRRWPVSTSPEVGDNGNSAWYRPNSNYDRSILVNFFSQMTHLAEKMGDAVAAKRYRNLSRSFGRPALSSDGRYLLAEDVDLNASHRHISHLLDIFPFGRVGEGADARCSLDHFERQGTAEWVGFTPVWTAAMESRLGNGDRALGYLKVFADAFVSRSGLHLNGDQTRSGYTHFTYHPFTLEANFCFARAVQEMLIGAYADGIRLFPAVPVCWQLHDVSFRDLRVPGGHRISATLRPDGSIVGDVKGFSDTRLSLLLPDGSLRQLDVKVGRTVEFDFTKE